MRIFGPQRSCSAATDLCSSSDACRSRARRSPCSSCVPCEKLKRATSIPASMRPRRPSSESHAGPSVQTSFGASERRHGLGGGHSYLKDRMSLTRDSRRSARPRSGHTACGSSNRPGRSGRPPTCTTSTAIAARGEGTRATAFDGGAAPRRVRREGEQRGRHRPDARRRGVRGRRRERRGAAGALWRAASRRSTSCTAASRSKMTSSTWRSERARPELARFRSRASRRSRGSRRGRAPPGAGRASASASTRASTSRKSTHRHIATGHDEAKFGVAAGGRGARGRARRGLGVAPGRGHDDARRLAAAVGRPVYRVGTRRCSASCASSATAASCDRWSS